MWKQFGEQQVDLAGMLVVSSTSVGQKGGVTNNERRTITIGRGGCNTMRGKEK